MAGKLNLVIVDGRHSTFKKRDTLGNLKNKQEIPELIKNIILDEQSLKHISNNQEGFKFFILYPTQTQSKSDFYSELRKVHPGLLDSTDHIVFVDLLQQDLQNEISQIVSKESQTNTIESVSLVSHNLLKFQHNLQNEGYPIHRILISAYTQEFNKRRKLEVESYSKKLVDYHISTLFQVPQAIRFLHRVSEEQKKSNGHKLPIYNIGYYFDFAKQSQMNTYNLINASYPYKYTPLDFRLPYDGPNPPYGVDENDYNTVNFLIHKFQDFYKDKSEKAVELVKKQEIHFADFLKRYSDRVHFIDDTEQQDKIRSRIDFDNEFQTLLNTEDAKKTLSKFPDIFVSTPKILPFNPADQDLDEFIQRAEKNIIFPVLVKSVEATSSKESHFMGLIHNIQSLKNFLANSPMAGVNVIVQEMINHDARINKLYVIGTYTEMQVRVSIPNIDVEEQKGNDNAIWTFDSQKGFKEQLPIKVPDKLDNPNSTLNRDLISELSVVIGRYFKINLFGYDIVQRQGTQEYYIVDINYFPGFKNFQDLTGKFKNLYQDLIAKGFQKK